MMLSRSLPLAETLSHSQRAEGCVPYDPAIAPAYGYDPNLTPGIVFSVVFGLSMLVHVAQTIVSRKWWYSTFAIGAFGELMGWAARAAAHKCAYNKTLFSLQISILIISPCFFSAGIYYILGQLINKLGRQYSPISPRTYLFVFIGVDLVSIIIQGVGGGLASSASGKTPPGNTATGTHIMIAGIIIQLVSMCVFVLLWIVVLYRARAFTNHLRLLIWATSFSSVCILVRNFYRAVELSQGWKGYLITHEVYFCVLDSMLMILAVAVFNLAYPASFFKEGPKVEYGPRGGDLESPDTMSTDEKLPSS